MQLRICGYPIAGQHFYKFQIAKIVIADMRICCCGATFLEKVVDLKILKWFLSSFVVVIVKEILVCHLLGLSTYCN
jgi:biotin transporter BioY